MSYNLDFFDNRVPMEDNILWVLTVPAIWSDRAKKFMREVAQKVSILTRNVLSPESKCLLLIHVNIIEIGYFVGRITFEKNGIYYPVMKICFISKRIYINIHKFIFQ